MGFVEGHILNHLDSSHSSGKTFVGAVWISKVEFYDSGDSLPKLLYRERQETLTRT